MQGDEKEMARKPELIRVDKYHWIRRCWPPPGFKALYEYQEKPLFAEKRGNP
jgi:hypothetical protein